VEWLRDALGIALGAIGTALAPLGALSILVLPGLAVSLLLFPGRSASGPERAALVLGLSVSVVVLAGVLLGSSQVGLPPEAWRSLLLASGVVAILTLVGRGARLDGIKGSPSRRWLRLPAGLVVGVLLALAGYVAALMAVGPQPLPTELSIVPARDGRSASVTVYNGEARVVEFRVRVSPSAGEARDETVTLDPGEDWTTSVRAAAGGQLAFRVAVTAGDQQRLQAWIAPAAPAAASRFASNQRT
jgi:hypothetical protein